uniref:Uncharacterized protein n=1 Tax=Setaria italica TaxID=4555 RepID=K3Z254_SETIT
MLSIINRLLEVQFILKKGPVVSRSKLTNHKKRCTGRMIKT